ncbi:MAG: YckD family protein [Clostridia bacterium]|nr:YckD family protein [Clostridia bacterium]
MKNLKLYAAAAATVVVLATAGSVFASEIKSPAEIASQLTGKSIESLNSERASGKTYGAIAREGGKLDEFKAKMLEQKKAILDQRVAEGKLTREKADEIYAKIKENMASCDGTGSAGIGKKYGASFGSKNSCGVGKQAGGVMGRGSMGKGMGFGRK